MLLPFILPMPSSPQFLAAKVRVTAGAYAAMVSEEKIARKVKIKAAFLLCMNKQIFFLRLHRFRQRLVRCGGRGKGIISLFLHYFSLTTCADSPLLPATRTRVAGGARTSPFLNWIPGKRSRWNHLRLRFWKNSIWREYDKEFCFLSSHSIFGTISM